MTREEALILLKAQCAATVYPVLSDQDIADLLDATLKWTIWAPTTAYEHGTIVLPTVRNGHVYRAIVNQQYSATPAGVSAATEPIWPIFSSPDSRVGVTRPYWAGYDQQSGNYSLSMVTDGTVVWQDAGPDAADPYGVRLATYAAILRKIALATADYDVSTDGKSFKRSQVLTNLQALACRFAPTSIA